MKPYIKPQPDYKKKYCLENLIDNVIRDFDIDKKFLCALIKLESNWNPFAMRIELKYPWLYEVPKLSKEIGCTITTMKYMQSISWGLMQIMGATAYEIGFSGWATQLTDPEINLHWGCKFLRQKILKYGEDPATLYASYNAGTPRKVYNNKFVNQRNVDEFMKIYKDLS